MNQLKLKLDKRERGGVLLFNRKTGSTAGIQTDLEGQVHILGIRLDSAFSLETQITRSAFTQFYSVHDYSLS